MAQQPFRQIHLDFHVGDQIPGVGSAFDPDEFADTLQAAHVNSVTCFARDHHGWMYYDTEKFPERRHPHLTCNLLKEQIEACHARGIRVPIYTTVQWEQFTAHEHPEWLCLDENGCVIGKQPFEPGYGGSLCLNTPYVDFLEEHTIEICEMMDVDGLFFDIIFVTECCCPYCIDSMLGQGLDPSCHEDRVQFMEQVRRSFLERMFEVVRSRHPEATVFFNSGHIGPYQRKRLHSYTHLELESLPSHWGYSHFAAAQRYARTLGLETLGMTGKFHTVWGDFNSFKNPAALEFECLRSLALNAKCSIGDQPHPDSKLCEATYDLIAPVYAKVEAAEPWCQGAEAVVDIGVLGPEEFVEEFLGTWPRRIPPATYGVCQMLEEAHQQFDVIDSSSDFSRYRVLILADQVPVNDELAARLADYLAAGGSLIATYKSGLTPEGDRFSLPELGVSLKGEAPYSPDFIVPGKLAQGLRDTGYVMYEAGLEVEPGAHTEVLSPMLKPYFNRTWRHFSGHRHTPVEGPADYPGAVRSGNCIYFMHPLFQLYYDKAPRWCKQLLVNALEMLLPEPLVQTDAPSTAVLTLNAQPDQRRLVLHALHYIPQRRGQEFDVIEDIIPLYDVLVSIRADGEVSAVTLVPEGEGLAFEQVGSRVEFVIPEITGHQMVAIQLGRDTRSS